MSTEIQFLGHSSFLIKHNSGNKEYSILIDPFLSQNPKATIDIGKIDVTDILVTHAHADHLGDAIPISKKKNVTISAIFELANYCAAKGALSQGVNIGGKVPFEWGKAYWLSATHSSSTVDGVYGGCPASILIEIDGIKIYHGGDTGLHMDMKMIGDFYKPDIAILPIGGLFTMGIDEAIMATQWLKSKTVIPMHYNTFKPIEVNEQEFKNKIEAQTEAKCELLMPNESYNCQS